MKTFLLVASSFLASAILSQSALALPYYQVSQPTGNYAGQTPKGYVLVIHGGGWDGGHGAGDIAKTQYVVDRYTNRGYAAINTDYRAGGDEGFQDVVEVFDTFRSALPNTTKMCVYGESAGAQFALLLSAIRNSAISCTISAAAPADFTRYGSTPGEQYTLSLFTYYFGAGPNTARYWSPVTYASSITKPVLLATAANDPLVPPVQATYMNTAMSGRAVNVVIDGLDGGSKWVHSFVAPASLKAYHDAERAMIDAAFTPTAQTRKAATVKR